ncbi:hypothetical protein ACHAXN_006500 [Cyclotella atomus]
MSHYGPSSSSGPPPHMRHGNRGMRPPPPPPPRRAGFHQEPMMQRHHGGPPPPRQGHSGFLPPPPPPPPPPPGRRGFPNQPPPPLAYQHQQQQRPMQPIGTQPQRPLHAAPPIMPPMQPQHQLVPPPIAQPQFAVQSVNVPQPANMAMAPPIQRVVQPAAPPAAQGWTQHAHEGRVFYYNSITKQSTYDRPACLANSNTAANALIATNSKSAIAANTAATASNISANTINNSNAASKWKEYTDPSSGKKYYSDGVTTTWIRPAELGPEKIAAASPTTAASATNINTATNDPAKKDKRKRDPQCNNTSTAPYSSKSEATAAFKGLLLAKAISPHQKYQEVSKLCSYDSRWNALQTIGERKQALAEYQTKRNNELKEMKRVEIQRGKEAFHRLLSDTIVELNNSNNDTTTIISSLDANNIRYEQYRDKLSIDSRFHAIEHEELRITLFYEYIEESQKRIQHNKRLKLRQAKESFVKLLQRYQELGKVSRSSTYSSFLSDLTMEEKQNANFTCVKESDRQLYFADYVLQLQCSYEDQQRRIEEARMRAEKAQRGEFRSVLLDMARNNGSNNDGGGGGANVNNNTQLRPFTPWKEMQPILHKTSAYEKVYAQDVELPRELYMEFVNGWKDVYVGRDRKVLLRALGLMKKSCSNSKSNAKNSTATATATSTTKSMTKNAATNNDMDGYQEFETKMLEASSSIPELYTELRRMLSDKEVPLSSFRVFYEENIREDGKRKEEESSSSEDEGEIIED